MYRGDCEAFKNYWLESKYFILTVQIPLKDSMYLVEYLQWLTIIRADKMPQYLGWFSYIYSNCFINFKILLIRHLIGLLHTNTSLVLRSIRGKLIAGSLKTWGSQFLERIVPLQACEGTIWIYVFWLVPNLSSEHSINFKLPRLVCYRLYEQCWICKTLVLRIWKLNLLHSNNYNHTYIKFSWQVNCLDPGRWCGETVPVCALYQGSTCPKVKGEKSLLTYCKSLWDLSKLLGIKLSPNCLHMTSDKLLLLTTHMLQFTLKM
jgi:hypothetical protein